MSRIREFLIGLFTKHLGAKLLALLLAVGLFGFVQSSLTGTQEVARVELRFRLADELRAKYVILTETRTLNGLTMTGLRSKVDILAKALAEKPEVPFTVDQRFLDDYANLPENIIPITTEIFRDDPRFKDITVGNLPTELGVEIDELEELVHPATQAPARPAEEGRDDPHVLGHVHVGKQSDTLDHIADAAAQLHRIGLERVASVDVNRAGGRLDESIDHLQSRGLAAARLTDENQQLARRRLEADSVYREAAAVVIGLSEPLQCQHGSHGARCRRPERTGIAR